MWCTNRLLWHTNSDFYGIRTPTLTPYEPFLLGVGVVFNILNMSPWGETDHARNLAPQKSGRASYEKAAGTGAPGAPMASATSAEGKAP